MGKLQGRPANSFEAALIGSVSGAFSAAVTTPLDVAKTRLMLGSDLHGVEYKGTVDTLLRLYYEGGSRPGEGSPKVLFSGVGPRVAWMGIGGFVFFGAYEFSRRIFANILE